MVDVSAITYGKDQIRMDFAKIAMRLDVLHVKAQIEVHVIHATMIALLLKMENVYVQKASTSTEMEFVIPAKL